MVLSVLGLALAVGLAMDGLRLRLFGESLMWAWGPSPVVWWARLLRTVPQEIAWVLVIGATSWLGALSAFWMRLSWSRRVLGLLLAVSLLYFGLGTIVAVAGIVCLRAGPTCRWLAEGPALGSG